MSKIPRDFTLHMGDLRVNYKDGDIEVFRGNKKIDTFNEENYGVTIKTKAHLKQLARKRFEEVDDYRSPNGKDVTASSGIQNPQVKIFKLGGKWRVFDQNGNEVLGSSSHSQSTANKEAKKLDSDIKESQTLENDKKSFQDSKETQEGIKTNRINNLSDVLEEAKAIKNVEDEIKMREIFNEKAQAAPIEPPSEEEAPQDKGLFEKIKDSISGILPTSESSTESAVDYQPQSPLDLIKERYDKGELNANQARRLVNKLKGEESSTAFQKDLRDKQGARRQTLDRFDKRLEGNEKLVDRLEGYREGVSEELQELKGIGKEESERMRGLMPGDDFKLDWGVKPTFENSRDIWNNEFAPNYKFSSDKPFNQREHELALSGYAGGSALEGNQRKKMGARTKEELENMGLIQDMLVKQQAARGVDISDVQTLGKRRANSYQDGLDAESKTMTPLFEQEQRAREQGDELSRTRAEAETSLTDNELLENSKLHDFLENQRSQEMQELQKQGNLEFETNWAKIAVNEAAELANNQLRADQVDIWVNRNQTYAMLERTGIAREELEQLKQAEGNPNKWASLLGSLLQTAGTVVGSIYGGKPGAILGNEAGRLAGDVVSKATESKKQTYSGWGERGSPFRGER